MPKQSQSGRVSKPCKYLAAIPLRGIARIQVLIQIKCGNNACQYRVGTSLTCHSTMIQKPGFLKRLKKTARNKLNANAAWSSIHGIGASKLNE